MFILRQLQRQFYSQVVNYGYEEAAGLTESTEPKPEPVEDSRPREDQLAELGQSRSEPLATKTAAVSADLDAQVDTLQGSGGQDIVRGENGEDTLGVGGEGNEAQPGDIADDTTTVEQHQEAREAVITQLTEDDAFPEGMDEADREELIQARLEQQAVESEADIALVDAQKFIDELGFEELGFESEVEATEFRQKIIDGLELDGTESPEQIEALVQEQFEVLKAEHMAVLNAQAAEIQRNINNPNNTPQRRQDLQRQSNANNVARNIVSSGGVSGEYGSFNQGGIGISPDQNELYGERGGELAQFLETRGFRSYDASPNLCGKNCGEAINDFYRSSGKSELQISDRPRHGFKWAEICASRPDDFVKLDCTPQEAPAGAIISYNKGTGGSDARNSYGHVEIALGENTGYYFGKNASTPGGSNPNFASNSYQIYMPKSQGAQGTGNAGTAMS